MSRGGMRVPNGNATSAGLRGLTTSRGTTATPSPSATRPISVPLSSVRKTTFRSGTRPRRIRLRLARAAPPDQRHARELAQRRRRLARRELGVGGDDQDIGVAEHLGRLERALGERQVGEGEVELAVLEQAEQVDCVGLLATCTSTRGHSAGTCAAGRGGCGRRRSGRCRPAAGRPLPRRARPCRPAPRRAARRSRRHGGAGAALRR